MGELCRAYYRGGHFCQQPCKGDFRHGDAAPVRQLRDTGNDFSVRFRCGVVFEFGVGVFLKPLGGFAGTLGEPPSGKGAVWRHGDILIFAERSHLSFFLAGNQVVMSLYGHKLCQTVFPRVEIRLCKLPHEAVGNADIPCLSRLDRVVQPLHDFFHWRVIVPHVIDIEVNIVHSEIFKASIQIIFNVFLTADTRVDLVLRAWGELCSDHIIVPFCKISECFAHILLAGSVLIDNSGIVEIDTYIKAMFDDLTGLRLVHRPTVLARGRVAEAHAAHADAGNGQIRLAEFRVLHRPHLLKNCISPCFQAGRRLSAVQDFSFDEYGVRRHGRFQFGHRLPKSAAAGGGEQHDPLAGEIIAFQKSIDNGRCYIPPDGKTQQDGIIRRDVGIPIRQRGATALVVHFYGTAGFLIHPVQVGSCVRHRGFDLIEVCSRRLCQLLCNTRRGSAGAEIGY